MDKKIEKRRRILQLGVCGHTPRNLALGLKLQNKNKPTSNLLVETLRYVQVFVSK